MQNIKLNSLNSRLTRLAARLAMLLTASALVISCAGEDSRTQTLSGNIFGTTYNIKYLAHPHSPPPAEVEREVLARLNQIDAVMSTWNQDSELSRLNAQPVGAPMRLSGELGQMLLWSRQLGAQTGGAFDISVGPLVRLWGFGEEAVPERIPTAAQIAAAREQVGLQYLLLRPAGDAFIATKQRPLYLTLDAIAKGYGVDEAGQVLGEMGIDNYLVEIGGEILAKGTRPGSKGGWRIAIEQPSELRRQSFEVIGLADKAMATSGDYRNYYEKDGIRYSHIIDPRTAKPVRHRLASVSVVHDSAAIADAWATALFVLGAEEGLQLADRAGIAAYFIQREGEEFIAIPNRAFTQLTAN